MTEKVKNGERLFYVMKQTLVLIDDIYEQYHLKNYKNESIRFGTMLKARHLGYLTRIIRKLHLSSPLPKKNIWFSDWETYISNYCTVILGDAGNSFNVARCIKKKYPDKRIIVWYRNSIASTVSPTEVDRNICELWTFDKEDSINYKMQYNPQFYMKSEIYNNEKIEYDAFFIGQDKGRLEELISLESELKEKGMNTEFLIVGYNAERIPYEDVIKHIFRSKAIVDIQASWQDGIT